jgi:hypothetical protein
VKKISFGLLELEMADLERFWRKTPLGLLGVKLNSFSPLFPFVYLAVPIFEIMAGGIAGRSKLSS